jgi:hypothetical protein
MSAHRFFSLTAASLATCVLTAGVAQAKDKDAYAVSVELFGGGYVRSDKGFVDHARVFGYDFRGSGGGGIDVGFEIVPRLSVHASWSAYTMAATRRLSEVRITSQSLLGHARYAFYRQRWPLGGSSVMVQVEGVLGAGYYHLRETYDDPTLYPRPFEHKRPGFGMRGGIDASVYYGSFGLVLGYAFQYSPAHVEDDLGGKIYAGGHEITGGLALRF